MISSKLQRRQRKQITTLNYWSYFDYLDVLTIKAIMEYSKFLKIDNYFFLFIPINKTKERNMLFFCFMF